MVQYLLNTTFIWLVSLIIYDLFLSRQTFHTYNRLYLLSTFIMGIILPLVSLKKVTYNSNIAHSIETANSFKHHVVAYTAPTSLSLNIVGIVWVAYLMGAVVSLLFLLLDILKLTQLFRNGYKWEEGKWTIIATGKKHGPFSLFRMMFISDVHQYSESEWSTVLKHEQQHNRLLHFGDIALMQLAKIIFWFHPLAYAYNKRLLMVHEYQADKAASSNPRAYAHFLISQSMLYSVPGIVHTFYRSPIKKRIVMLTHRSKRSAHIAKLLAIPMTFLFLALCTKSLYSQGQVHDAVSTSKPTGTDTTHTIINKQNPAHDSSAKQVTNTDTPPPKKTIPFLPMQGEC